jgi:hypothetical protein
MKRLFAAALVVASTTLCAAQTQTTKPLNIQDQTFAVVSFCQLVSQPDAYLGREMTLPVTVKSYRHGTAISDRGCPKQSLLLVADQAAVQNNTLSHFYQFLAEHKQTSNPIFATITGRLVRGEDGGFVLKRNVVFKLESVSGISEGSRH